MGMEGLWSSLALALLLFFFAFLLAWAEEVEGEEDADDDDKDDDDDDRDWTFIFVVVAREADGGASSDLLWRLFASPVVAEAGALRFLPMVGSGRACMVPTYLPTNLHYLSGIKLL